MKNLDVLYNQLKEVKEELIPLLEYSAKCFMKNITGDLEIRKKINPLIARERNILININQLKQKS